MRTLVWLRRDFRVHDNTALLEACARGDEGTIALYVLTPEQWREHDDAPAKIHFWLENLRELSMELGRRSIPLLVRQVDRFNDIPPMLRSLVREHAIEAVFANREYEVNEQRRDQRVAAALAVDNVPFECFDDRVILPPNEIRTGQGRPYSVFTPYRKRWSAIVQSGGVTTGVDAHGRRELTVDPDPVPDTVDGFDFNTARSDLWPAGEGAAHQRLERFIAHRLATYDLRRDLPGTPGTSELSPYLAAGVLSPRQCLHAAASTNRGRIGDGQTGPATWMSELIWREFYTQVLVAYPRVSMGVAYKPDVDERVEWRHAPDELAAWQEGRTGVPIVDAAQRQLVRTGWMHNRLRMVSAMFLCKTLLLDWREGERFFMRHLVDGDLAANNGGWQWSASTGTDSAPYFRVFNPIRQGERFDAAGDFVGRFVPELSGVEGKALHDPRRLDVAVRRERGYPDMIVDPKLGRQRAIEAFRR